jgi:hypothetical protein
MEQPATPETLKSVPLPQPQRTNPPTPTESDSTTHLINNESQPQQPSSTEDLPSSSLFLRFPKPLGNRQLTNWISSSSPDIMQRENTLDDEASLAELGYDIIGTDGESQAESTTSSFDYQKPDDIHSLAGTDIGTDVDTDSSDDEENTLNETATSNATIVETVYPGEDAIHVEHIEDNHHEEEEEEEEEEEDNVEAIDMVNRSLESPTNLSFTGFSPFTSVSYLDNLENRELDPAAREEPVASGRALLVEHDATRELLLGGSPEKPAGPPMQKTPRFQGFTQTVRWCLRYILPVLCSFLLSGLLLVGKSWLSPSAPGTLETVPVASVSVAAPLSIVQSTHTVSSPTPTIAGASSSLQTASPLNGHMFIPFVKDKSRTDIATVPSSQAVFSVELADRDKISVKIPSNLKAFLLAKNALLISVSRGPLDISTKVSIHGEGLMIQVPLREAHGVVEVRIATKRKPHTNESFRVDFGTHRLTEALDVGKQLVRGFAQRVVDTVNETTWWVEETYIPTLDVVSKQVCDQTASVSGSLVQSVRDVSDVVLGMPSRLWVQIQQSLGSERLVERVGQVQLELVRQTRDIGDELRMILLKSQMQSRLLWLKMQGKTEEHRRYMSMAEKYWKEQRARVDSARVQRAEYTKNQIRSWQRERGPVMKSPFWRLGMGGA